MHIPRLFTDAPLQTGTSIKLPEKLAHHVLHVLRSKLNDPVILFDGAGGEYPGRIIKVDKRQVEVMLADFLEVSREPLLTTVLGLGITKRDAMNTALQKATELGVTRIIPVETANTSVARKQYIKRFAHWQAIVEAASEQCGRTILPDISEPTTLNNWLSAANCEVNLIASPTAEHGLSSLSSNPASVSILIGPEGGLTGEEELRVVAAGAERVKAGRLILRAETAPLVFLTLIQAHWGDF